ncbi:MAG: insulinase family protein [Eubacterium sp.]|nr:insulinase family protein [Eubacterium sp.]
MKEIISNARLNEEYIRVKHPSGATLILYPMKGYSSAYALFGTRYGSVDTTFKTKNDDDFVTVPEGIAHYLEHKLFENDECDAFELYAKTGANANAFTSFDKTAYLFSCSQKFEENLEILLGFVQDPYFTDETVAKEQGIIGQEIRMYEDDPGWRVFFNCLQAMYHNNPVRIDIAGTVESIAKIDKDLLYRCYNTFYNLNNMVIAIAGNFDVDKTLEICDRLLKPSEDPELETKIPDEPYEVLTKRSVQKLSCAMPLFNIGFKLPNDTERFKNKVRYSILMDMCLNKGSDFFERMYESKLINYSFNTYVFDGRGFFSIIVDGESRDPDKVLEETKAELRRLKKEGLDEESFITVRNTLYGSATATFGIVENVAHEALDCELSGVGLYYGLELVAAVTFEDVKNALDELDIDNCSISIIEPAD